MCVRLWSPELHTLTNFIGKSPKNTLTIGKTYSAPKITYTRKAHYATNFTFPHFLERLALPTYATGKQSQPVPTDLHWI